MSFFRTSGALPRKLSAALSYLLGTFVLSAYSGLVLLFRDGFHPDGVKSTGFAGVLKALPDVGLAALIGGVLAAIGWAIQTTRSQTISH